VASPPDRRKIVHVLGALAVGGAERFVTNLLVELARRGRNLELLVLSSRSDEVGALMAERLAGASIPWSSGPTLRVRARTLAWYARALRRAAPQLVHLHTTNTELAHYFSRWILRKAPRIVRTIHSSALTQSGVSGFVFRNLPAAMSIACGEATRNEHHARLADRIVTIPNGVAFDWPVRTPELATREKNRLGLDPDRLHFLCVGSHLGESPAQSPKAHDLLIRAWRAADLGERCVLHLLGDGVLRASLEGIADQDSSIRFHGIRSDVSRWLLAADCFVMPSRWEGLPMAAIEAVGSGLPCIFSSIPPLRELNPPQAIWFEVNRQQPLTEALREFADRPVAPENGDVEAFREQYGIARTAARYDELYTSVLDA
jgi:glycosyltransferase involved in cell wall biosynthesis